MNNNLFQKLHKDRLESSKTFKKRSMKGFSRILKDMYADKAHFIFELIQNADDAEATNIRFILENDHLIFIHDGIIKFSVSDPDLEEQDSEQGSLGHINSICSIANTTKSEQKIGKFGIGFKSIFQYTDSPVIVDDNFSFEIRDLFVPIESECPSNDRRHGETLFFIPFNKMIEEEIDAFEDVHNKLESFPEQVLLFLNNISLISFRYSGHEKSIKRKRLKKLLSKSVKDRNVESSIINLNENKVLFFSTYISGSDTSSQHRISVTYPLDNKGQIASETKHSAYCYFPTSEPTELNFMIHAPFLLTDNRQNIKDHQWNKHLVDRLSDLITKSLFILRDNNLLTADVFINVLPLNEDDFKLNYYEKNKFYPIFSKIVDTLRSNNLLPTTTKSFSSAINSYLFRGRELISLLPPKILAEFVEKDKASVVFPSITDEGLIEYCRRYLGIQQIRAEDFIDNISVDFIKNRTDEWLIKFYRFCNNHKAIWDNLKEKPIIRLSNDLISAPYKDNTPIVFLEEVDKNYPSIKPSLLTDKISYEFFKNIGIGKPDKKAIIFRDIVQRYKNDDLDIKDETLISDFSNIITYYYESNTTDAEALIELLSEVPFLSGENVSSGETNLYKPCDLYILNDGLKKYFTNYTDYAIFDVRFYKSFINKYGYEKTKEFLLKCGVSEQPKIVEVYRYGRHPEFKQNCTKNERYTEYILKGYDSCVLNITLDKSRLLWKYLSRIKNIDKYKEIEFRYFYHTPYSIKYESEFYNKIKNDKWIYGKKKKLVCPSEIYFSDMNEQYDTDDCDLLVKLLDFKEERTANLTSEEKDQLEIGKRIFSAGISESEIDELIEHKKRKKLTEDLGEADIDKSSKDKLHERPKSIITIAESFERQKKRRENEIFSEQDSLCPMPELTEEKINKIKTELEDKETEIIRLEELRKIAQESEKYSFIWFKALLELEFFNKKEDEIKRSTIRIRFTNVKREDNSERTLLLNTTENIPIGIEDNGELQLTLNYLNAASKSLLVEAVSRQNNVLKAKMNENIDIESLNLAKLQSAVIEIKNANFIFENLKTAFNKLADEPFSLTDNYNFQSNLPADIKFIYGPPGTGKTTRLSKEIYDIVKEKNSFKILILCPTNKAADVLTTKLMALHKEFPDYLVRFGITNDQHIENTVYSASKSLAPSLLHKLILITTIARFTYDFFKIDKGDKPYTYPLKNYDWDYLIFDEASMITLPSIVFSVFHRFLKKRDTSFIVTGDPFQIGPIVQTDEDDWKEGNIYSLVNLNHKDSFIEPRTLPHKFPIENLTTQYRSVPVIGKLFSKFTYNGILNHHRKSDEITEVSINGLKFKPLTLVNFNVNPFESIYRPRSLKNSPYQIYSALLVVEFISYVVKNIVYKKSDLSIGIICPYRAQQNIINKLLSTLPNPTNINISTGTIHSFQGDECDIILAIFNPPINIFRSDRIFLNKQNILNVAISRAKDYLFMFMPVDPQQRIKTNNLFKLCELQSIIKKDKELNDNFIEYTSDDIEQIIFNDKDVISNSCFSTGHQEVNVYSKIDKKYEIRYDEYAVDIQVRKV